MFSNNSSGSDLFYEANKSLTIYEAHTDPQIPQRRSAWCVSRCWILSQVKCKQETPEKVFQRMRTCQMFT